MAQYTESWTSDRTGLVVIEGWAGGAQGQTGGSHAYYAGSGGGQYAVKLNVSVVITTIYTIFRGKGGNGGGGNGGDTDFRMGAAFATNCLSKGGTISGGGLPIDIGRGDSAGAIGDVIRFGGNGGIGDAANDGSAGSGGSGGRVSAGTAGGNAGVAPGAGGVGGDNAGDGHGASGSLTIGHNGVQPGGGASPGVNFNSGGIGADGAWAVWAAADWDFINNWPNFGTTPLGSAGTVPVSPALPPVAKKRKSAYII